jgi:hypothetical protein
MKSIKHIGRLKNTGSKVLVIFRTLPGESNQALVLQTATLPDAYHDSIMTVVESDAAQDSFELGELLHIRMFPDGKPMLRALQADGRLQKVPTDNVLMTPTVDSSVQLDQLNLLIAEQRNCAVDDLCYLVKGAPPKPEKVESTKSVENTVTSPELKAVDTAALSEADLARSYRSQADALYKEAARLRKQADDLDPPKKKSTTKVEVSAKELV